MTFLPPLPDCALCPRLAVFRLENRAAYPAFHNAPVPAFGELEARLLIVGLAPGLKGANVTGRPFTGDYAGDVLYESLQKAELASGDYAKHAADGLTLHGVRITNAVRCVPPENKPVGAEITACNDFLRAEIAAMPHLRVIVSLGGISHKAVLRALGLKQSAFAFAHGALHEVGDAGTDRQIVVKNSHEPAKAVDPSDRSGTDRQIVGKKRLLLDSYHCSRYNVNTGRLSQSMFDAIIQRAKVLAQQE